MARAAGTEVWAQAQDPTPAPPSASNRFEVPKASMAFSRGGVLQYGLPEQTSKKIVKHHFEEQKHQENCHKMERMMAQPTGPRFANRFEMEHAHAQYQEQYEQKSRMCKQPHKLYYTSKDSPLYNGMLGPAEMPSHKVQSKRTYNRDTISCMRERLGHSLVPVALGTAQEHAESDGLRASDQSEEGVDASRLVAEQRELERRLLEEYPHGIPKGVLRTLQKEGRLASNLPALGFGFSNDL